MGLSYLSPDINAVLSVGNFVLLAVTTQCLEHFNLFLIQGYRLT